MTTPTAQAPGPSLLKRYGAALQLDGREAPPAAAGGALAAEVAAHDLPPLLLPAKRKAAPRAGWAVAAALAALVPLAVYVATSRTDATIPPIPPIHSKGTGAVTLFWERAGRVTEVSGTPRLANGDRVLAQVLSPTPADAFWGAFDAQGAHLSSWAQIRASRMPVSPGKRQTFASSLQLVGANEGETLVVMMCASGAADQLDWSESRTGDLGSLVRSMITKKISYLNIKNCKLWCFILR